MSDALVGRGLYPFVGASTDASSPTSDPTASTWASKPIPGQRAFETDTLNVYEFDGLTWLKTKGAGILETRTFTINAATDCFTDKTAPVAAELLTADSFAAGKKRCRITMHVQPAGAATDIPHAAQVVATLNPGDDGTALARLTYVDVGAGGTGSVDTRQRMLSAQNPIIEWDLTRANGTIDRADMGGYLPVGTGTLPVYLSIEVW